LYKALKLISELRSGAIEVSTFVRILQKVLEHHTSSTKIDFTPIDSPQQVKLGKELRQQLFVIACVVEELVTNSRKHSKPQKPQGFKIDVTVDGMLEIRVKELTETTLNAANQKEVQTLTRDMWKPYGSLLKVKRGRGTDLIEDAIHQLGIVVQFAQLDNNAKVYSIHYPNTEHEQSTKKQYE
jgi:two-component sensor histidine kinase